MIIKNYSKFFLFRHLWRLSCHGFKEASFERRVSYYIPCVANTLIWGLERECAVVRFPCTHLYFYWNQQRWRLSRIRLNIFTCNACVFLFAYRDTNTFRKHKRALLCGGCDQFCYFRKGHQLELWAQLGLGFLRAKLSFVEGVVQLLNDLWSFVFVNWTFELVFLVDPQQSFFLKLSPLMKEFEWGRGLKFVSWPLTTSREQNSGLGVIRAFSLIFGRLKFNKFVWFYTR